MDEAALQAGGGGADAATPEAPVRRDGSLSAAEGDRLGKYETGSTTPGVCRVHEAGEIDGVAFVAMQLVAGDTVERMARRISPAPVRRSASR